MGSHFYKQSSMRILLTLLVFFTIFSLAVGKGKGKGGKGKGKPKPKPTKPSEGTTLAPGGGKGKGKGKPKPPTATEPPIVTIVEEDSDIPCIWCLIHNVGEPCIPICEENPQSWQCLVCIYNNAPKCLRICGFPWFQEKMLEIANPIITDPCVLREEALPLRVGYDNAVSSTHSDIISAEACGEACKWDPYSLGWTWANNNDYTQLRHTCWCLKIIGVLMSDVTRDSSLIADCPP